MPKTNQKQSRELALDSIDCSFILTHLIRQNDDKTDEQARDMLVDILDINNKCKSPKLISSDVGWYSSSSTSTCNIYNPKNNDFSGKINTKAVCFTESTLQGLKSHFKHFNAKYAISFGRSFLMKKGANPCINLINDILKKEKIDNNGRDRHLYNYLPEEILPFVNIISEVYDSSHEREWRTVNCLEFKVSNIKFLFCPQEDFERFSVIQKNGIPVLFDSKWLDYV